MKKDKAWVLKTVKQKKIKFIKIWLTDVLGFLKGVVISAKELEAALEDGVGFDGSSIEGFARIEESDMIAKPDPSTFQILPWKPQEGGIARMFADVLEPGGKPFEGDPRYILKKNLARARKMGYTYQLGPELEFFYFRSPDSTQILDRGGYFDLIPLEAPSEDLRRQTVSTLEKMGISVEYSHHEVASSQHEIDLRHQEALKMADDVMIYRLVIKEIARRSGVYATFMPKPIYGMNGSGMHTHQSLFKGNKNVFFDPKDKYYLSTIGKQFIAGLLKHAREICSVTAQWVNSYKRLVPGYEAPVYITWAHRNRSALVRVPEYKPGKETATRAEFRCPDPACNPYLAFAVMLAAGLEGVEKGYKLPKPVANNVFIMNEEERHKAGIESLPEDLYEAIRVTEESKLVREALGERVFSYFIRNKKAEWDEYKAQVSRYEVDKYLPIL